ncbi:MAG: hypothetical protein ACRC46_08640 [Thermoguttaceae bacterium]
MRLIWFALLFVAAFLPVFGQDEGRDNVARYRYWYVPYQQPEVWPLGDAPCYVPISRHDFDAWIAQFERSDLVAAPLFRDARYTARLEAGVLSGRAEFTLPLTSDANISPTTLATSTIWFRADVPTSTTDSSANIVTGEWSLGGLSTNANTLVFAFKLPESVSTEIELALPAVWTPTVSSGFVVGPVTQTANDTIKNWRIILGTRSSTTLTLTRPPLALVAHQQTGITETILWDVAPQGMQATSKITFDTTDPRPREFFLDLDAPLRLVDVKCDEVPVTFLPVEQPLVDAESPSETGDTVRRQRVLIRLPESTSPEMTELEVTAQAAVSITDQPTLTTLELPKMRLVSPSIYVRESRGTLLVRRPLLVREIAIQRASQTSPVGINERPDRDVFAFQFFDGDASVTVRLDQQRSEFAWSSGTQVFWNGSEIAASMTLDVSAAYGNVYLLEFPIHAGWNIESVQWANASDAVSWSVRHDIADSTTEPHTGGRTLEVKLATPLEVGGPSRRLRIEGRHSGGLTSSLANLIPIAMSFPLRGEHGVAIDTPETFRLQWDLLRFPKRQILANNNPLVERRFSENPDGTLFPLQRATSQLDLMLVPQQPALAVNIEAHIVVREQEVQQVYSFRCRPSGSTIDSVTIEFAADDQASSVPIWDWRLRDETERPQVVRLSGGAASDSSAGGSSGSVWEIRFANPRSAAFEIIATRTQPIVSGMSIALPSVLSATEQQAELFIESTELVRFRIDNTRLELLSPPVPQMGEFSTVRSILRYIPEQEVRSTDPAVRLLDADADSVLPAAWVWIQRLHSQFETSGVVRSSAMLRIENRGTTDFDLTFPAGVTSEDIRGIWVGDRRLAWVPKAVTAPLVITIPLPERNRFVTVTVEFTLRDRPLAEKRKLSPATPQPNIPVVNDQWIAWIPPDFVVSHKTTKIGEDFRSIDFFLTPSSSREARPFDPLVMLTWDFWRQRPSRETELQTAANDFITLFSKTLHDVREATPHGGTWGDVVRQLVGAVDSTVTPSEPRANTSRRFELLIDRTSLAGWDVFPTTPLPDVATVRDAAALLDAAGIVVLANQQETPGGEPTTQFYLTTFLNLACHRDEVSPLLGESVWAFQEGSQESGSSEIDSTGLPFLPPITNQLAWVTAMRWTSETTPARSFWGTNLHEREFVSVTPTWNAYPSLTTSEYPSLYVVQRDTIVAWGWLLCIAVILVTQRRPLSHPIFLLLVIIQAEVVARNITLCYAPLPTGVFLGGLFSLLISLVRLTATQARRQLRRRERASTLATDEYGLQRKAEYSTQTVAPHRVTTFHETDFEIDGGVQVT